MDQKWLTGICLWIVFLMVTACGSDSNQGGGTPPSPSGEEAAGAPLTPDGKLRFGLSGLQVQIPEGFEAAKEEGTTAAFKDSSGTVLIVAYDFAINGDNAEQMLRQPLTLEQQVVLQPNGAPDQEDTTFQQSYQGGGMKGAAAVHTRPATDKDSVGSLSVLVLAKQEAEARKIRDQVSASVELSPMQRDTAAEQEIGRGTYSPGRSNHSEGDHSGSYVSQDKTTLTLCSGQIHYYSKHESFVSVPGAGSASNTKEQSLKGVYRVYTHSHTKFLLIYDSSRDEFHSLPLQIAPTDALTIDGQTYHLTSPGC